MSDSLTILCGDALEKLRELPDESVQCCVTSPPFWGLRDYGTSKWNGGDDGCDHAAPVESGLSANKSNSQTHPGRFVECSCGAKRIDAQLGLEKTPEEYVAKMVEVFREARRVLRKDGTLWLNLGDSYATTPTGNRGTKSALNGAQTSERYASTLDRYTEAKTVRATIPLGMKPKDLCGIPWMVAFALRADSWWLRSDIIWAKPNPMPESVTDRPTKSHEYIFLLTKSAHYFYDAEAIKEKQTSVYCSADFLPNSSKDRNGDQCAATMASRNNRSEEPIDGTRNKRSVWTVTTQPYPEAHFATYPPDLIKPCILAGSRVGDTILDPFAGSGTTGQVALELGRRAILIDLNPKYIPLIHERTNITPGLALAV